MNFFYFFLFSLVLPAFSSTHIEGGRLATLDELHQTGTVAIVYREDDIEKSSCTGVRIAPHLILTAAHCVYHANKFPVGIRQSLNPLDKSVKLEPVKALKFPFKDFYYRKIFKAGYLLDIALLILEEESSEFFPLISEVDENDTYLQLGYGMDFHFPTKPIFPLSLLENGVYDPLDKTSDYTFTLRNEGSSPRSGDSGGPVLTSDRNLVGVLSSGSPLPLADIKVGRVIYMGAYHFIEWIRLQSRFEDFNSHFKVLRNQFTENNTELITKDNFRQIHQRLCREVSHKLKGSWSLSEDGTCLQTPTK